MHRIGAQAEGIANISHDGTVLDTWYPSPQLVHHEAGAQELAAGTRRLGAADLPSNFLPLVRMDADRQVEQVAVHTTIADLKAQPLDAHDVYLRLHLLSHRLIKPHEANLDNALRILSTVVWTNKGPCLPDNFEYLRTSLKSRGLIHVYGIEKLPRMVDYVVPSGVGIAEAERVRLGAYLAPGTRVVREGFVSFNAGALGAARIEGRMASGATIGAGTEIGLSAVITSKMRADGHREPISVGRNCRIGIGSGVDGVTMGNNCSIGPNIIIEPNTDLYDVALAQTVRGQRLDGQSNWQVRREAGYDVPTVRWSSARGSAARGERSDTLLVHER